MARVLIPLAEGFEEVEAVTIADVLRRGGVGVVLAAIGDELETLGAHGIAVKADVLFSEAESEEFDAIVLPGGGPGTERLRNSDALVRRLRRQAEEGRLICAICAAPTVLVEAGVLEPGVHVTCYPTCQMELDRAWSPVPVVADANVITGQAPGSALLFSLVVLQVLMGEPTARKVARAMVTDVLDDA
ncbi:MAG: DJ-1/PfpI family protein [Kiritimatiellae bacterium]|nr:DJ-1/PfpI family protein [Kiritimatiellia bacterium]